MSIKTKFIGFISNKISNIEVILEIGSRDAIQSIEFSKLFPNAKVYTFECYPPCIEKCVENIKNFQNIEIIPKAVSNINGKSKFYPISRNVGAGSLFKITKEYGHDCVFPQEQVNVESIRIDTWAKEKGIEKIDLVWIDIQGAEYEAFEGMGEFLPNIQAIYTEVENKELYIGQKLMKDVTQLLDEKGFFLLKYTQMSVRLWGNAIFINSSILSS